uniref:Uncharacterized protein n=1 Tax=Candidatus Kentrum sp. LPFa TaxID=2126335 RepID=A0A450XZK0_9GAMM|nr:MAG: hypothetical protein BECKLPF1236A_GA0070988_1012319 [Candidatus Kentron sp. LPFa]VFK34721.1 MAG: hypothetical protein BECKLPF1236C_GA0070990_102941 [Candidatus Kentron sp. LPFa]
MCNHHYSYVVDEDFGPLFIKFASYFPYTARICIRGHEYAKRQLAIEGIEFEAPGYNYRISILQAEFSRTQVCDRPLSGRPLMSN